MATSIAFTHYDNLVARIVDFETQRKLGGWHTHQFNADTIELIPMIKALLDRLERLKSV